MTNQETLELALNALKCLFGLPDKFTGGGGDVAVWRLGGSYRAQEAIKALEEALAKQEPDYKALWKQMCERCDELDAKLAKQEQSVSVSTKCVGEPVGEAYLCDKCQTPFDMDWLCPSCGHNMATKEPVYTTPYVPEGRQQRPSRSDMTWVGLTDEDDIDWDGSGNLKQLVEAVEAKLKEKNT